MKGLQHGLKEMMSSLPISSSIAKPEPKYCRFCKNEKLYKLRDVPIIGKRWQLIACQCEIEVLERQKEEQKRYEKRKRINRILRLGSVNESLRRMTFDNFYVQTGGEKAYAEVKDAVTNFKSRQRQGLMLFGQTGNGKTHLTAAGANILIDRGYTVIFLTEKDLLSRLKETKRFSNKETFSDIMDACLEADLLVWDDFFSSQQFSREEKDWVFQIVNKRELDNKPIWATSNFTEDEFADKRTFEQLDDKGRIWWRMIGNMNCVYNQASNYRMIMAVNRMKGAE